GSGDVLFLTRSAPYEKSKFLGSGGSIVARLKLKEINGRALLGVNVTVCRSSSAPERSQ
ncbi:hypothetical protein P153DRAFT_304132, partial [Dothidotthia symphoricarpi CBS 119687]